MISYIVFILAVAIALHGLASENFWELEVSLLSSSAILFAVSYGL